MQTFPILLPCLLLIVFSCGQGGAKLETDNVQAEWFPEGSHTTMRLEEETPQISSQQRLHHDSNITFFYYSLGNNKGFLEITGEHPESAIVTTEPESSPTILYFKTTSREIVLTCIRKSDTSAASAVLNNWSYKKTGTNLLRTGTSGKIITEK